jgi:hypothetical protein
MRIMRFLTPLGRDGRDQAEADPRLTRTYQPSRLPRPVAPPRGQPGAQALASAFPGRLYESNFQVSGKGAGFACT